MSLSLGIIGTGNVGTALYKAFAATNVKISWYSRHPKNGQQKPYTGINLNDDILLLAVPDDQIESVASNIKPYVSGVLCHVSGATPLAVIQNIMGINSGVFYPLQTIRKEADTYWKNIPICLESMDEQVYQKLHAIATLISEKVYSIDSAQRIRLHLAAVILNNFGNHLAVLTRAFLKDSNVDFSLLNVLIEESAAKLLKGDFAQTGPAIRGDIQTIERHKALLGSNSDLRDLYETFSNNIQKFYKNNL